LGIAIQELSILPSIPKVSEMQVVATSSKGTGVRKKSRTGKHSKT